MSDAAPFDRRAVRAHRQRAASRVDRVAPILHEAADRLLDRLDDTTRRFTRALDLGGRGVVAPRLAARSIEVVSLDLSSAMAARAGGLPVVADEERLPFAEGSFDLVVASLSLHWINDLPGTLIQIRHALRPDGLFLASIPVLDTLSDLRRSLIEAEGSLRGGASPRISPFPELRDCAALLQRAGFALPVADAEELALSYADPLALLRDLQAAGESNAIALRDRSPPPRALMPMALALLAPVGGRVEVTLRLAMLTGWAPAPTQPKPLKPGAFTTRLTDVFGDPSAVQSSLTDQENTPGQT